MTRPRVTLVGDNDSVVGVMKVLLEHNDCEVVPAASVTDARNQIVTQHFDAPLFPLSDKEGMLHLTSRSPR